MMESFFLRSCKPSTLMSKLSINICPSYGDSLNKVDINDDLPAPVRPTMPT